MPLSLNAHPNKRNHDAIETNEPPSLHREVGLEMLSDEEGDEIASDDGHLDEFPGIDTTSDSDEEDPLDPEDDEDTSEDEDEDQESDTSDIHVFPKAKDIISDITGKPKRVYPEIEPNYDSDSSTEDTPNRIGNVPMHWYDDMPHVGYDMEGKKVLRPARGDELDKFLQTVDDPSAWTSAFDKNAQMDKPLTPEELDLIRRLHDGENPDADYDPYEPTIEWFTGKGKEEVMPLSAAPEPKRRWIPSKWEKQKVMKIVRAIRQGRIIPSKPKSSSNQQDFYSIWSEPSSSHPPPLPAPKPRLPTNAESYNPPEEYLPTDAERAQWESLDPEDRERDFLPQKYPSLRLVPAFDQFIKQRFNRQLDLYLAPRIQRVKLNIDPNTLIPKLPSPNSLKPFPNYKSLTVSHGNTRVRCVSVSPDSAWAVSGDEGGVVSLWEVNVGREVKRWTFEGKVGALEWCPRVDVSYFVVGTDECLHFLMPPNLSPQVFNLTQSVLAPASLPPASATPSPVKWTTPPTNTFSVDVAILTIQLPPKAGLLKQIAWHKKGDYLSTVSNGEGQGGVWIHQVTKRHSQAPFKKIRGSVQLVLFHPTKPHFFVATQQYVRIYNLSEQKLLKTLTPGIKWISSMDVHPSGDHLIVGGYDRKLCWFDLELSEKPYKVLRYHARAIRSLHFHPSYPLFASSSDDGSIQIFHSRIYNDLMTDPLIVPLKILRGHTVKDGLGVLQVKWCSKQPWLSSAGADVTSSWTAPTEILLDAVATEKLTFAIFGLYLWELFTTISTLEFPLLRGELKLKWTSVIFFFLCRYCQLLAFIGLAVFDSVTVEINCDTLYKFTSWALSMSFICASSAFTVRTLELWKHSLFVVFPLTCLILGHWGLFLSLPAFSPAAWDPTSGSCVSNLADTQLHTIAYFYTVAVYLVLLVATAAAHMRKSNTDRVLGIRDLLLRKGMVFYLTAFMVTWIPAIFALVNLNFVMDTIAVTPTAALATIAACRYTFPYLERKCAARSQLEASADLLDYPFHNTTQIQFGGLDHKSRTTQVQFEDSPTKSHVKGKRSKSYSGRFVVPSAPEVRVKTEQITMEDYSPTSTPKDVKFDLASVSEDFSSSLV